MRKTHDPQHADSSDPKALADAVMLSTLRRACNGTLRRNDAPTCLALMQAYEAWSNASKRCELVERAGEIIKLGQQIGRDGAAMLERSDALLCRTGRNGRRKAPASK